ncbi:MFS transporter [Lutimonas zeaxanthinifaciens]|uniref:MFS transporter n=1 Tax=Lutimonas zeaxanthinifaciens TaxID=3060215 RepID=UPI00265D509A|nr:MFS transporter [Lutimonas sp. YSD2104]WKK67588.1 MFS transporter [Lutimonas sp. YSD2104]
MNKTKTPWHFLLLLILAGESVFILPFVLSRVFRPTVLQSFNLDNIELGICFSIYGIVAFLSYFFGGPLADKYASRKLIATSLWLTSAGGLFYATFPGYNELKILYGYWGFTTIFLFWAPMIKATRIWGGTSSQGKAFGFLDGGRGLVGALFGTLGVLVFSWVFKTDISTANAEESREAFKQVIIISSVIISVVGVMVWFLMKFDASIENTVVVEKITLSEIREVLKLPAVWLLMLIILCSYTGYKITDLFSLYARDVMNYDQVRSAQVGTFLMFVRPVIGVLIGILADRSQTTLWLLISFVVTFFGALIYALGYITESETALFFLSILIVASGVYASRALYFSVMEKGRIPIVFTGTAVGIISIIGYTPDIFAGPAMGYLLEKWPGIQGHQYVFWMLTLFSFIGCIASFYYYFLYANRSKY